ncbi:RNA polymerase sigma-70 factor [Olivibacter sp. CPCC 100613]|uniref:RNA polymerase sigma factor n=1 Tax=Olivibacter sp. CPCC 100613 TaxID=3079931 RepID=UPI002FF9C04E
MDTLIHLSDLALIDLIRAGNDLAFKEIFKRYNRTLFAHAYNKLRDQEEAKDVVQDIFLKLWNYSQQADFAPLNLASYLHTAVRNRVFDTLSKSKHANDYLNSLQTFLDEGSERTDDRVRTHQLQEHIDRAILSLPSRMRLVFEMSRKEHLSHKEIAQQLNISDQTVTDQIKKALKILRSKLGILVYLLFIFSK